MGPKSRWLSELPWKIILFLWVSLSTDTKSLKFIIFKTDLIKFLEIFSWDGSPIFVENIFYIFSAHAEFIFLTFVLGVYFCRREASSLVTRIYKFFKSGSVKQMFLAYFLLFLAKEKIFSCYCIALIPLTHFSGYFHWKEYDFQSHTKILDIPYTLKLQSTPIFRALT